MRKLPIICYDPMRAIWSKRSQCYTPCYVVRNSPRYSILRSYSDSSVQGGLGPQIATVPNRAVLSVTGPEPNLSTFLNGLLSTHVVAPSCSETRKGFYSLFLSPQVCPSSHTFLVLGNWLSGGSGSYSLRHFLASSPTGTDRISHRIRSTNTDFNSITE